jgi:hypothetical protein
VHPRAVSRKNLAHPFHLLPTAATRRSDLGRDFGLSRSRAPKGRQNGQDASRKRRTIHIFKDRHQAIALAFGLNRVSSTRPKGYVLSRHAPASACELDRTVRRFLPNSVRSMHDLWQLVAGRPARCPPFRREPRRATSLGRFHRVPRERPELPRSEIPSIAREPEGPKKAPIGLRLGDFSQCRFTRHGFCHFGLSSMPSTQPQPRGENPARPCLTTSATTAKAGHISQTFETSHQIALFMREGRPLRAASGETPVLAAGASKAPVHRPADPESAYATRANRPARVPPNTSCRLKAAIGRLESDRSPTFMPRLASSPPRERKGSQHHRGAFHRLEATAAALSSLRSRWR